MYSLSAKDQEFHVFAFTVENSHRPLWINTFSSSTCVKPLPP